MTTHWLSYSLVVLAVGSATACGSSNDSSASGGNGSGANGQGASAQTGGGADSNGGTQSNKAGSQNAGGALNNAGSQNAGGSKNAGGSDPGGSDTGGTNLAGGDAGGSDVGGTDPGGKGGMGVGGSVSMPAPDTFPLLVAVSNDKVQVWEHADALKTGDPPAFELPIALGAGGKISGVVATRQRLGVVASSGLFLFDDLGKLSASSKPAAIIPPAAFADDLRGSGHEVIDADGDLWLTYGSGRVALFESFNTLTATSKPKAEFTHEWDQLASSAYYAPADILFVPQISGAGLLYYSKAKTRTGVVAAPDGAFDKKFTGWQSAILGDSLFASADSLGVWHGLDKAVTPRAPDATLSNSGLYVDASADALVIADSDHTVSYFASATSLAAGSKPQTFAVKPFIYGLDLSNDAKSIATISNTEVAVITHDAGGLELQATLSLGKDVGQGNDVTFVE